MLNAVQLAVEVEGGDLSGREGVHLAREGENSPNLLVVCAREHAPVHLDEWEDAIRITTWLE